MTEQDGFRCVVDASVGIKLFVQEPLSSEAEQVFQMLTEYKTQIHVPDLFFVECSNVLWKYVRRGALEVRMARSFIDELCRLELLATPTFVLAADALELAYAFELSAYDATYAVCAQRVGAPLVTADTGLVQRLRASSITAVLLSDVGNIL